VRASTNRIRQGCRPAGYQETQLPCKVWQGCCNICVEGGGRGDPRAAAARLEATGLQQQPRIVKRACRSHKHDVYLLCRSVVVPERSANGDGGWRRDTAWL
jgi:hypothetical protein